MSLQNLKDNGPDQDTCPWIAVVAPSVSHIEYQLGEEPEKLHLVRSGFSDDAGGNLWFVFREDAYQLEPWASDIELLTADQIYTKFKIDIYAHAAIS